MRESQIEVEVAHTRSILVKDNFRNEFDSMKICSKVILTPVSVVPFHDGCSSLRPGPKVQAVETMQT
jgi:hypothetical protein